MATQKVSAEKTHTVSLPKTVVFDVLGRFPVFVIGTAALEVQRKYRFNPMRNELSEYFANGCLV